MISVSMVVGLLVGTALFFATRKHATAAVWTALVLGIVGTVLFVLIINGCFLPEAGMFEATGIGIVTGIATALALGCLIRGERRLVNWIALAVSAPPVLFLIVFGIGNLLSPGY